MTPHLRVKLCSASFTSPVYAVLLFLHSFAIFHLCGSDESENLLSDLDAALHLLTRAQISFKKYMTLSRTMNPYRPMDCQEVLYNGYNVSGIYTIWPRSRVTEDETLDVFCDMDTDGGGWTVLQRRGNFNRPKDYFNQNWDTYKKGFGDLDKEFWIGNDNIFALTNQHAYSARFDLESLAGEKKYALYDDFWIDDENQKYTLHVKDYSGDAGDAMQQSHNNMKFSAPDQDNDVDSGHCASKYEAGWWFKKCYNALLNGLNVRTKVELKESAIHWMEWLNLESLHATEIKIRPKNFMKFEKIG